MIHRVGYLTPFALIGAVVASGIALSRCSTPKLTPLPSPTPQAQASAIASSMAMASQSIRVTIRRPIASDGNGGYDRPNSTSPAEPGFAGDANRAGLFHGEEEIIIELSQSLTASSSSAASASIDHIRDATQMVPSHARLGAVAITAPGVLAASYQLGAVELPMWVIGTPLEVGVDVVGNLEMIGAGLSVGDKAFAAAGGWSRWSLTEQGWYLGLGMRF